MSQVIAVVSGKGGTGKTSFTTLTGMALAQLGKKTLLLDCDIGLRNLDLYLGVSDRALMDFTDVIAGRTTLAQAVVRHPLYPNLYLLTAPVSFGVRLPGKYEMQRLLDEIRRHFDFCLIDAAAASAKPSRSPPAAPTAPSLSPRTIPRACATRSAP